MLLDLLTQTAGKPHDRKLDHYWSVSLVDDQLL
uniref:Uncharacterized protein n=1 Tax=Arundo donax TaxID=35708 RepID=A0A0A8YWR3_ARUDO